MHPLRTLTLDSDSKLSKHFMPHQIAWIQAEKAIHAQHKQAVALAEKSVRIGWTYADGFKNVRKRLWFKNRDYLFATKDYPSALEYIRQCYKFAEIFNLTRTVISHGEESLAVNRPDEQGRPTSFTDEVKVGVILENGWWDARGYHPCGSHETVSPEAALLWSEDPSIWRRLG